MVGYTIAAVCEQTGGGGRSKIASGMMTVNETV